MAYCHTRLHVEFSAKLRICQVQSKMEPRSGIISCNNHPPTRQLSLEGCISAYIDHIGPLFRKYVRCPHLPVYIFLCGVPPQFISVPWTLWLCLGFRTKVIISQVPAFKMKPSSTWFLECGTPRWACHILGRCHKKYTACINKCCKEWPNANSKELPNAYSSWLTPKELYYRMCSWQL